MAGAIMNKVWDFLGVDTPTEEETAENVYEYNYDKGTEPEEPEVKSFFGRKNKDKVVNMPGVQQVRMVITQPTSFEQTEEICDYLKARKSVVINLEYVNNDVARRVVDFISGAVQALDGHIEKISPAIFLIAPVNYEITSDLAREEIKSKLSFSWLKNN